MCICLERLVREIKKRWATLSREFVNIDQRNTIAIPIIWQDHRDQLCILAFYGKNVRTNQEK